MKNPLRVYVLSAERTIYNQKTDDEIYKHPLLMM